MAEATKAKNINKKAMFFLRKNILGTFISLFNYILMRFAMTINYMCIIRIPVNARSIPTIFRYIFSLSFKRIILNIMTQSAFVSKIGFIKLI